MMQCDKITYVTHQQAQKACVGVAKRDHFSMKVYKCKECGLFHLTSIPNHKKLKVKKEKYQQDYLNIPNHFKIKTIPQRKFNYKIES